MKNTAQGALEYLLLIGGAVVIAAIVTVGILGFSSTSSSASQTNASNIAKITFVAGNSNSIKTYLKMNDFSDSSAQPVTYTNSGATTSTDHGGSLFFDGSSYMASSGAISKFTYQTGFTYMAWVKPTAYTNNFNMIMGQSLPYFNIGSGSNNQKLHMSLSAGGAQRSVYGNTSIPLNQWTHVAATYDPSGYMKVYVNGAQDGIAGPFSPFAAYNVELYLGQWNSSGTYRYTGYMDDVVVLNYALTPEQIRIFTNP